MKIRENYFLALDKNSIQIWIEEINNFNLIYKINLDGKTSDLLLIDDNNFIVSFPKLKKLAFFNLDDIIAFAQIEYVLNMNIVDDNNINNNINTQFFNLNELKNYSNISFICNIDCSSCVNSMFKIEKYLIINCNGGIAVILLDTKEFVSYYEIGCKYKGTYPQWLQKKMCYDGKEFFYILYLDKETSTTLNIMRLKYSQGILEENKKFRGIFFDGDEIYKFCTYSILNINKDPLVRFCSTLYCWRE